MTVTNAYTTIDAVRAELRINDFGSDDLMDMAINAASRQIDAECGRFFYQDTAVVDRTYYADSYSDVEVDDISTTTGLIVKVDNDDDGTFETTLTISTNFILLPTNAAAQYPVQPYTCIRLVDYATSSFPMWSSGRPGVQVTAKFGWPAVPEDIEKACRIQAVQLYKSSDAVFGGLSFDAGILRVREGLNPMAAALVARYAKPRVA